MGHPQWPRGATGVLGALCWVTPHFLHWCHIRVFQPRGTPCTALPGVPKGVSRGRWHPAQPWGWDRDPAVLGDPRTIRTELGRPCTPPCPNPAPGSCRLCWKRAGGGHWVSGTTSTGATCGSCPQGSSQVCISLPSVPMTRWPPARPQLSPTWHRGLSSGCPEARVAPGTPAGGRKGAAASP